MRRRIEVTTKAIKIMGKDGKERERVVLNPSNYVNEQTPLRSDHGMLFAIVKIKPRGMKAARKHGILR